MIQCRTHLQQGCRQPRPDVQLEAGLRRDVRQDGQCPTLKLWDMAVHIGHECPHLRSGTIWQQALW